jgi:protein-tyrosine-phosphatase
MKPLFICRQNTGRSQVAMELFKLRYPNEYVDSAGTAVDDAGQKLAQREAAKNILTTLESYGIDASNNIRKQLTPEIAEPFDILIVMAEPDTIPDWLESDKRTVLWEIDDMKDQDLPTTMKITNEIDERVKALKF